MYILNQMDWTPKIDIILEIVTILAYSVIFFNGYIKAHHFDLTIISIDILSKI